MHTYTGETCNIHYNGDYSGNVHIYSKIDKKTIEVSMDDLEALVGEKYKSEIISRIEAQHSSDFLKYAITSGYNNHKE